MKSDRLSSSAPKCEVAFNSRAIPAVEPVEHAGDDDRVDRALEIAVEREAESRSSRHIARAASGCSRTIRLTDSFLDAAHPHTRPRCTRSLTWRRPRRGPCRGASASSSRIVLMGASLPPNVPRYSLSPCMGERAGRGQPPARTRPLTLPSPCDGPLPVPVNGERDSMAEAFAQAFRARLRGRRARDLAADHLLAERDKRHCKAAARRHRRASRSE